MRQWSKDCLVLLKQAAKNCVRWLNLSQCRLNLHLKTKVAKTITNLANDGKHIQNSHSCRATRAKCSGKKCVVLPKSAHQKSAEVNSIRMACHQFKIFEPAVFRAQNKDGAELREEAHWPQQIMACQATKR